jgi:hypothetical protein
MLGLGYDIKIGNNVSLTPFWNGFAVRNSNSDVNVGQLGLNISVIKWRPAAAAKERVVSTAEPTPASYVLTSLRQPEPAPVQVDAPSAPPVVDVGRTALPEGTNFVGDTRIKLYYPISCATQHAIPPEFQVFFQSEGGAMQDGFKPSGDC